MRIRCLHYVKSSYQVDLDNGPESFRRKRRCRREEISGGPGYDDVYFPKTLYTGHHGSLDSLKISHIDRVAIRLILPTKQFNGFRNLLRTSTNDEDFGAQRMHSRCDGEI